MGRAEIIYCVEAFIISISITIYICLAGFLLYYFVFYVSVLSVK